jgi:hypothetical protein
MKVFWRRPKTQVPSGTATRVASPCSELTAAGTERERVATARSTGEVVDGQHPILQLVGGDGLSEADVRALETEHLAGAAEDLRQRAFSLPPDSEIRALFLRCATRLAVASAQESGPGLALAE